MKLGILGYGRLGSHLCQFLTEHFDIIVFDKDIQKKKPVQEAGLKWCNSLKELCASDIIIPFVPISAFEASIKDIAEFIKEDSIIVDVCSVKVLPVKFMLEHLPKSVQILATHPMFGPDSTENTLFGQKLVLCPIRIDETLYTNIKHFLKKFGLKVIESTPEEHDHQIANTLLLSHLVGRSLLEFDAQKHDIDTLGYRRLMKILKTVENDSWQLFEDMNKYNPYAKKMRDSFSDSMTQVLEKIQK